MTARTNREHPLNCQARFQGGRFSAPGGRRRNLLIDDWGRAPLASPPMDRRVFIALALAGCAQPTGAVFAQPSTGPTPAQLLGATGDPAFIAWLNDFYARSLAAGWPRAMPDREL